MDAVTRFTLGRQGLINELAEVLDQTPRNPFATLVNSIDEDAQGVRPNNSRHSLGEGVVQLLRDPDNPLACWQQGSSSFEFVHQALKSLWETRRELVDEASHESEACSLELIPGGDKEGDGTGVVCAGKAVE